MDDENSPDSCTWEQIMNVLNGWLYVEPLNIDWDLPENAEIVGDSGYVSGSIGIGIGIGIVKRRIQ